MKITEKVLIWVAIGAIAALGVQSARLAMAKAEARNAALTADSLEAALDTSREISASLTATLGDSVRFWQRRAFQVEQERDDLDRALGQERRARARLALQVQALDTVTTGDSVTLVPADSGVRVAHFDLRREPYTVEATAYVPPPGFEPRLVLAIALDRALVDLRIGCFGEARAGVRPAQVTATGPPWLPLEIGRSEIAPDVCSPPARASPVWDWAGTLGVGAGAGALGAIVSGGTGPDVFLGMGIGAATALVWKLLTST